MKHTNLTKRIAAAILTFAITLTGASLNEMTTATAAEPDT